MSAESDTEEFVQELVAKRQLPARFKSLRGESDRGCILVAGAMVDHALEELIRGNLHGGKQAIDALLGRGSPIETYGARIALARCLNLVQSHEVTNFEVLRKIRNHAAHHPDDVSFKDQKLIALVGNFRPRPKQVFILPPVAGITVRQLFMVAVELMLCLLWTTIEAGPAVSFVPERKRLK